LLADQLRKAWRVREASSPIHAVLKFEAEGLVLGAGTVLAEPGAYLTPGGADETRLLTLLSAAYDRRMTNDVVGHIRSATNRWREADQHLADLHLALTRLERLPHPHEAARRLFMTDGLMRAGAEPGEIMKALGIDGPASEPVIKYSDEELRNPAGNGVFSGRWMRDTANATSAAAAAVRAGISGAVRSRAAGIATHVATRAAGVLADLSVADLAELALLAGTAGIGAVVVGGVLFYPGKTLTQDGDVPGYPGLKYRWNPDELGGLQITSTNPDGSKLVSVAMPRADGTFVDNRGRIVGRRLPDGKVAIEMGAMAATEAAVNDEPNFCPKPTPDRPGRNEDKDRDYEDFVKRIINSPPTPRAYGVRLPNPDANNAEVVFDDCQRRTGIMIEAKRTGYAWQIPLADNPNWNLKGRWADQALRQIQAAKGRTVRWYFAEPEAAAYAQKLFNSLRGGRERIEIRVLPWRRA
jgi:hypothetical protein